MLVTIVILSGAEKSKELMVDGGAGKFKKGNAGSFDSRSPRKLGSRSLRMTIKGVRMQATEDWKLRAAH